MLRKAVYLGLFAFSVNVCLSLISCRPKKQKATATNYCVQINSAFLQGINEVSETMLTAQSNTVKATDLKLRLYINYEAHVCFKPVKRQRNSSLFSAAYAFTGPNYENYSHPDSVIAYDLYSDQPYDDAHPAGTSLKDIFSNDDDYVFNSIVGSSSQFNFYCEKAPSVDGVHIFTVMLLQKNGTKRYVDAMPIRVVN